MEVLDSLAVEGAEEGREGHKGYLQCGGENNVQRPEEEACRAQEDDVNMRGQGSIQVRQVDAKTRGAGGR